MSEDINSTISEETFIPSQFNSSANFEGLIGFAKRVQNLLIMEPSTLPNCTGMGVGIRRYLMEFADNLTEDLILLEIDRQISEYLPNNIIRDTRVTISNGTDGKPVLTIYFKLNRSDTQEVDQFAILLQNGSTYGNTIKIVSDIYI